MILSAFLKVQDLGYWELTGDVRSANCLIGQTVVYAVPPQDKRFDKCRIGEDLKEFVDIDGDIISEKKCSLYSLWEKEINKMREMGADIKVCFGKVTQ